MEAQTFHRIVDDDGRDYTHQWLIKTRQHWIKVFNDAVDMGMFTDTFNALCLERTQLADVNHG